MNENNKVLIYNLINEYIHGNDEIKDIKNDEISEVINDIFTDVGCFLLYEDVYYAIDILIQRWDHLLFVNDANIDNVEVTKRCWDRIWNELLKINECKRRLTNCLLD